MFSLEVGKKSSQTESPIFKHYHQVDEVLLKSSGRKRRPTARVAEGVDPGDPHLTAV